MKIYSETKGYIDRRLKEGKLTISIFGIGKMGLPLACVFAEKGFKVFGVGRKENIINHINQGKNPIVGEEGMDKLLKNVVKNKKLQATTLGNIAVKDSDVIILIVPTLIKNQIPDLSAIIEVAKTIGKSLATGSLVILESTVPPGTTQGLLKDILEKESGLKVGVDFGLAFCPERTNSGTAIADIKGRLNPKIVGGFDKKSALIASLLYKKINKRGVVEVSSLLVAEMIKITEMVYRDVKISYANSIALICDELKINADEVIKGANTDAGCQIMQSGGGVGGHCIPVYPYFVFDKVKKYTDVLKSARFINDTMPKFVVKWVKDALSQKGKRIEDANILILGIAYRGNVKETRCSPAIDAYHLLENKAKKVFVFDPLFDEKEVKELGLSYKDDYKHIDCLVIYALHEEFKHLPLKEVFQEMETKIFIDTTHYFDIQKLKKIGFTARSIGTYSK